MWLRRPLVTLLLLGVCSTVGLTASLASPTRRAGQTPERFMAQLIGWVAHDQYGRVYDDLHPAQQAAISRAHYSKCSRTLAMLNRQYFGFDISTLRLVRATTLSSPATGIVPGTHVVAPATPVRLDISMLVRGKRTTLPYGVDGNAEDWVVLVGGRWRYEAVNLPKYVHPHCGMERPILANAVLPRVSGWARDEGFSNNATAVAGARLFAVSGCVNCHQYDGFGERWLAAPDLTAEGATRRGVPFQLAHLKCPPCVRPGSPMPSFGGLGDANLHKLAVFLEASKGRR